MLVTKEWVPASLEPAPGNGAMRMDVHGMTDRGMVRARNEDQFLVADLVRSMIVRESSLAITDEQGHLGGVCGALLCVADGVGGHAAGDQASKTAVEAIAQQVLAHQPWIAAPRPDADPKERDAMMAAHLQHAMACGEAQVKRIAMTRGKGAPGTTLTAALVLWPTLYIAHTGDSRCYVHRHGRLHRITSDQTLSAELVEKQVLSPEEAEQSPFRHVLVSALGGSTEGVLVEVHRIDLRAGDTVLLCSDGLTNELGDDAIAAQLATHASARAATEALVAAANQAGGRDNITVVVARV